MQQTVEKETFQILSADYFSEKAGKVKGKYKLLVALEMSKYLTAAQKHGISFEELEKAGFKFATLPTIEN